MSTLDQHLADQPDSDAVATRRSGLGLGSLLLIGGIVIAGAIFALALSRQNLSQPTSGPAPLFTATTFDGQTVSLADLRGKVVVINFWAGWCVECGYEAEDLQRTHESYLPGGEVVFIGIAYADNGPSSLAYLDRFNITYLNAPDLGTRISDYYNITGVPETFIIDRQGNVAELIIGPTDQARLTAIIDRVLAQS